MITALMHVTRTHHYRVVSVLGGIIVLLTGASAWLLATAPDSVTDSGDFLQEQAAVVIQAYPGAERIVVPVEKTTFRFVRVVDSCNYRFEGECAQAYTGPGSGHEVVAQLRNDMVLKVGGQVVYEGNTWYQISFEEQWLRYPERVEHEWYVSANDVEVLYDEGVQTTWDDGVATTSKRIIVDRSEQRLYAYDGDELFMETAISTGLELSPTPRGTFTVFKKMPSRYMQGPIPGIPGSDYYDLPGVPWNLYFTDGGAVVHGAYWHESFGRKYSHGCVNLPPNKAEELYNWAPLGTTVIVRD